MTNTVGGKRKGLISLIDNTDLGYKVPDSDDIGMSYYEFVERQFEIAKLAAILNVLKNQGTAVFQPVITKLPPEVEKRVSELAEKYQSQDVIARSNSLREGGALSFAGRYDSFKVKNVTKEKLADAVLKVYLSLNSHKAQIYWKEHGITDDKMDPTIHKFVDPDWSGVILTSNPTYPSDLVIEFCKGEYIGGETKNEKYIIYFDKKTLKAVFQSENLPRDDAFDLVKLAEIGVSLEKRIGASNIEFLIKNNEVYLVDRKEITDLEEPVEVKIPQYEEWQFISSTKITRGKGKLTLPVANFMDVYELADKVSPSMGFESAVAKKEIKQYFDDIVRCNEMFKEGYTLIIPQFYATYIALFGKVNPKIGYETTIDGLTTNKKAVITTKDSSISSHIMTIARDRGIVYAGFSDAEELFSDVNTGDILSIYFKGREAKVYREETPLRSIRETHPEISFEIEEDENGLVGVKTSSYLDTVKAYYKDFEFFLAQATGEKWAFKGDKERLGGIFTDPKGRTIVMGMGAIYGEWHDWHFANAKICKLLGNNPLPDNELKELMQKYAKHLTD